MDIKSVSLPKMIFIINWFQISLLQRVDEFAVVYGGRVDHFLYELSVTVGVGCGDVNKDLQVLQPVGQRQHLLSGKDIQLHCISKGEREIC